MGRNMFGPIRARGAMSSGGVGGERTRRSITRSSSSRTTLGRHHDGGGTTFHFVDGGIEVAREQACAAAGGLDVRIGGGVATTQQYLRAV